MEFDIEKIKKYYAELLAKRDEAVVVALTRKDEEVAKELEAEKEEIEKRVVERLTAEAEEPYIHDIKLCEKFIVPEVPEENIVETSNVNVVEE